MRTLVDRFRKPDCAPLSVDSTTEHYISTVAHRASLSCRGTATERTGNATSLCSTARAQITASAHNGYLRIRIPQRILLGGSNIAR